MIKLFLIAFLSTFFIERVLTHVLDGPDVCKPKTPTEFLRKKTGKNIHHIHLGFVMLILAVLIFFVSDAEKTPVVLMAVGLSLIADQIFLLFLFKDTCYFSKKSIALSAIAHGIVVICAFIVYLVFRY